MKQTPDITRQLALRLGEARKVRDLSIDDLSKLSGISGSVIEQAELGEHSPTVAALWSIAQALGIEITEFFENSPKCDIRIVSGRSAPIIKGRDGNVIIRILSAPQTVGEHEIYDIRFDPGASLVSEAHRVGCREDLVVLEGSVFVRSGDDQAELFVDDAANYAADCPHSITAGAGLTRVLLIVQNS